MLMVPPSIGVGDASAYEPCAGYSTAYAGNQLRAVRRFLRWLAIEDDRRTR